MKKIQGSDEYTDLFMGDIPTEYIQAFARRTGEEIGQVVTHFMGGILPLLLANRTQSPSKPMPTSQPSPSVLEPEQLVTAAQIANRLNISKAKAYQLMYFGEIPAFRIGRTTRVRKQDLERFIQEHTANAT